MRLILVGLAFTTLNAQAVIVVTDPSSLTQNTVHEAINILKWAQTTADGAVTKLNTLGSYENSVLQLRRYGDYGTYTSQIPGLNSVAGIAQGVMRDYQSFNQIRSMVNPQAFQGNMNAVLASYNQPNWLGTVSSMGVRTTPYQGNYMSNTAQWQVMNQIQPLLDQANQEEQTLMNQRDSLISKIQSDTTQAALDKDHAALAAVNGALSQLSQHKAQLMQQAQLMNQQFQAGQSVWKTVQNEQGMANFQQTAENGMLPTGGVVTATEFGAVDNPATGGTGDPGTTGTWFLGDHNNFIGGTNSVGVAVPTSVQIARFGSTGAAFGQPVQVTNAVTGQTVVAPIVDVSPEGKPVDLTFATARAAGLPVNGSAKGSVSFPGTTIASNNASSGSVD